jgi:hypothetical protein
MRTSQYVQHCENGMAHGIGNDERKLGPYMIVLVNPDGLLCGVPLRDGEQITVSLVGNRHDAESDNMSVRKVQRQGSTHPTRKSFPAAVPSATFEPAKW